MICNLNLKIKHFLSYAMDQIFFFFIIVLLKCGLNSTCCIGVLYAQYRTVSSL